MRIDDVVNVRKHGNERPPSPPLVGIELNPGPVFPPGDMCRICDSHYCECKEKEVCQVDLPDCLPPTIETGKPLRPPKTRGVITSDEFFGLPENVEPTVVKRCDSEPTPTVAQLIRQRAWKNNLADGRLHVVSVLDAMELLP